MSKELEALEKLKEIDIIIDGCAWNYKDTDYKEDFDLLEKLIKDNKKLKNMVQTMFNGMAVEPNDKNSIEHQEWSYIFNGILGELHGLAKDDE
jgi:hypothetical protein